MRFRITFVMLIVAVLSLTVSNMFAQQKGQWVPGQVGLDAGILPDPGISIVNISQAYSASTLNDANGKALPIQGTYSFWVVENLFYYVPNIKVLGGHLAFGIAQPTVANGSATLPQFGLSCGGFGLTDTYVQPFTLGWSAKRIAFYGGYAFFALLLQISGLIFGGGFLLPEDPGAQSENGEDL
jgi:hypothetical protein